MHVVRTCQLSCDLGVLDGNLTRTRPRRIRSKSGFVMELRSSGTVVPLSVAHRWAQIMALRRI